MKMDRGQVQFFVFGFPWMLTDFNQNWRVLINASGSPQKINPFSYIRIVKWGYTDKRGYGDMHIQPQLPPQNEAPKTCTNREHLQFVIMSRGRVCTDGQNTKPDISSFITDIYMDFFHCRYLTQHGFSENVNQMWHKNKQTYEGWNFNSGNYLFTTDTK